ncbi:septum formation family protein [Longispora urticae]
MKPRTVVLLVVAGVLLVCGGLAALGGLVNSGFLGGGGIGASGRTTPVAGDCRRAGTGPATGANGFPDTYVAGRVKCSSPHEIETVYVGVYASTWTEEVGTKETTEICTSRSEEYLGGKRHAGRIEMTYYLEEGSGRRWFTCDLAEVGSSAGKKLVTRSASLRGSLAGAAPMTIGCANSTTDDFVYLADCGTAHNAEFAGLYAMPADAAPADEDALGTAVTAGCEKVVTDYLGWDKRRYDDSQLIELSYWGASHADLAGDRTFQCYVTTLDHHRFTASVKGLGDGRPPLAG